MYVRVIELADSGKPVDDEALKALVHAGNGRSRTLVANRHVDAGDRVCGVRPVSFTLALLPGDGIGPEVVRAAVQVLDAVAATEDLDVRYFEVSAGGAAIDTYGTPLRDEDLENCRSADAVLLGAVGGPAWDHLPVATRPESGLLRLRSG